jgi:ferredoxin
MPGFPRTGSAHQARQIMLLGWLNLNRCWNMHPARAGSSKAQAGYGHMSNGLKMHNVVLQDTGATFPCRVGDSVLDALRPLHHRKIRSGCRNGGCGVCAVQLISGTCDFGVMSAAFVNNAANSQRVVLACRTYPRGDVKIALPASEDASTNKRFGFLRTEKQKGQAPA